MANMPLNLTDHEISNVTETQAEEAGYYPYAKPVGILILLSCIATLIANTILIISYHKSPNLHTPFNFYILSLSFGDLIQASGIGWAKMALYYNNGWQLGKTACTVHIYVDWVSSIFLFHMHLLISINRLWAVTSPLTYKQYHNKKLAVLSCIALWLYANAWILPALIPDALYYREDTGLDCSLNNAVQPGWTLWCSYIGYNVPIALIIVIYPVICWKFRQHRNGYLRRKLKSRVTPSQKPAGLPSGLSGSNDADTAAARKTSEPVRSSIDPLVSHKVTSQLDSPSKRNRHRTQNPGRVFHFKIISCLVLGVIVCWVPFCSLSIVYSVSLNDGTLPYLVGSSVLYYFNPLLNPIIYPLTSHAWRVAFRKTLGMKA